MATERTSRSDFVEAVAEARRIRGSINLEPADARRWSAIVAAVDGSLELRVGMPPRRLLRRAGDEQRWLQAHGFVQGVDCWVLPLPATTSDTEAAARWSAALEGAFGLDPGAVARTYTGTGVSWQDAPPVGAAYEEHVAAAMRAMVRGEFNRVHVFGGRPAGVWAFVWDVVGEPGLRIEYPHRDDPDSEIDTWHAERSPDGCRAGAAELLRRVLVDWPDARLLPLFIHLLTPHG
ncbi:hypothetical protein OM076_11865 [Solirubrobacter ginsenosidimutans]|uniref:Uncharacterized protein n=1 Tax=Solirubrobacter ginsenosidimutans TaxID=490573 RepID=A0A9X3S057_9ACTN|nr:hypothetical protein [Solirubrobacter ginsenosidimutans]MDA0160964.1 hypothetical protein [Solirubrobacter ginsenosidimutans]